MNYKKIEPSKIRSRLVRKGFFTQLPVINKEDEGQIRLFRTILDHGLFEATSDEVSVRKAAFKWFNPTITYSVKGLDEDGEPVSVNNVQDFNTACSLAALKPDKVRTMMLYLLDNYFPEVFAQTSCSFKL